MGDNNNGFLGYIERAFGCFQAIMEINLFVPRIFTMANLQITFAEMLMEFETFWDSEVPRFGEQVSCFAHCCKC